MKTIFAIPFVMAAMIAVTVALPQTSSFTIGNFTIDSSGSPAVTVTPPTRAGRLAVLADIPQAPITTTIAGSATLVNGLVTVAIPTQPAPPICVAIDVTAASPVRRNLVTTTFVSFEGVSNHSIEYLCTAKNN